MTVLIGIDQGTSGTRTVAFDASLESLAEAYRPAAVHHPQPGWIEKGAEETVGTVRESLDEVVRAVGGPDAVSAVGLDNEGETVVAWHAETLEPLAPAVVWGCRRSQPVVDRLEQSGAGEEILELSGLPLDPYFSATKIRWLVENVPAVAKCAGERTLRIGTLDAFLTARLGEGARTEPSTAGRTQLQEPARPGEWSPRLLELHGIEPEWLPPIGPSFGSDLGPFAGLRLGSLLVDQTASLAGHGGFRPPASKATYGSGIFLLQQRGTEIPADPAGLIPIVAWDGAGSVSYALDGGVFSAGTVITWLRDGAGLIADAAETEQLALSVPDTAGVHFLPALAGLGAPRWRSEARASFGGITAGTTRAHLVRAALDSLCFRVRDIVDRLADRPQVLRVDGGLTANRYLLQRQADVLGIPIEVARMPETTALGAAATAGVTAGVIDPADLERLTGGGTRVEPRDAEAAEHDYQSWRGFADIAAGL